MKMRILIVGDMKVSLRLLARQLCLEGYDIRTPPDGKTAISFLNDPFDFMIINSQMPDASCIDVLEEAAKLAPETRVIVLTAHPSIETAIKAIQQSDKDTVEQQTSTQSTLPSRKKILPDSPTKKIADMATIYNTMAGRESFNDVAAGLSHPVVDLGEGISIDLNRRVIIQNGSHIRLTPTENRLLKVLLENEGELLEHKRLVQLAQGYDTNDSEAPFVLRPLVSRLRHKLERIPGLNLRIINVRGTGYMVECKQGKVGLPTNPGRI